MKKNESNFGWTLFFVCFLVLVELFVTLCIPWFLEGFEAWYYLSQVVNCIVVTCGVVYAARQYHLSVRDSRRSTDIIRVQKAIDLAQFFKDSILANYPPVRYILDFSGISEVLNKMPVSEMQDFSEKEMRKYITDDDIAKLRGIQSNNVFLESLIKADSIYNLHIDFKATVSKIEDYGDNAKKITYTVETQPLIQTFMNNYITAILNNMEFFAMHFSHNTADSSVVYQSLHQAYIEIVERLYYFIAELNTDSVDKFYTNTISLYKKWLSEKKKNEELRRKSEIKSQTHGTVVE